MNICNHPEAAGCTAGSPPSSVAGAATGVVPPAAPTTARPAPTTTTEWKDDSGQWDNGGGDNGQWDSGQWDNSGQWNPSTAKPTTIRPPGPTPAVPLQVRGVRQSSKRLNVLFLIWLFSQFRNLNLPPSALPILGLWIRIGIQFPAWIRIQGRQIEEEKIAKMHGNC